MERELSDLAVSKIFSLVLGEFDSNVLPAPRRGETEPQYVARCMLPIARNCLRLYRDLACDGQGGQQVSPVSYLGLKFFPDLTVKRFGQKILAIEVKYLRRPNLQASVSTAVGQALIYQHAGYAKSAVFLVSVDSKSMAGWRSSEISTGTNIPVRVLESNELEG